MCIETRLAFIASGMLFMVSGMLGCKTAPSPLPEPAITQGLSGAETKLDELTEKRLSRVSAAVTVANEKAAGLPDSNEKTVIKGELGVAKAMVGEPTPEDFAYAKKRASEYSQENYITAVATSEALRKAITGANTKYEQEKAKKQAEYESKLAEKELEIKSRLQELEQQRIQSNNEKILMAGGVAIAFGILLSVFAPLSKFKQLGVALIGFGTIATMIPFIADETWFKYAVGGVVGLVVLSGIISFIISNRKNKVDNCTKSVDDPTHTRTKRTGLRRRR